MPVASAVSGGGGGSAGPAGATGPLRNVAAHSALKATAVPTVSGDSIATQGALSAGDGGNGLFRWLIGARPAEDGIFTIWHNTDITGYFSRSWDGRNATLAWAGLAAATTTAALQTAVTAMAGLSVAVDKAYTGLTAGINVPANTTLFAATAGLGFKGDGVTANLLSLGLNCTLNNLDLDGGVVTFARYTPFTLGAIVALNTGSTVRFCRIKNCAQVGIGGYNQTNILVTDTSIDKACSVAFFTQVCFDMKLIRVNVTNPYNDGIKIHTRDGTITTTQGYRVYLRDCKVDYSAMTLGANTLAVELWGGQTTFQNSPHLMGIDVMGPAAVTAGGFWAISLDTVMNGLVDDCRIDGGPYGSTIALEAAGCRFTVFRNNYVRRFRNTGLSISQARSTNISAIGNTFRESTTFAGAYGIQMVSGTNHLIEGNIFKDAGERYVFFNSAGNGSVVSKNYFHWGLATANAAAIYFSGVTNFINVCDNVFGPLLDPGETGTAFNAAAGEISGALNCTFKNNFVDASTGAGVASASAFNSYGAGGGHLFSGMRGVNNSGALVLQSGTGPASVFDNNFCVISNRTTGTIDLLVGRNS